MEFYPKLLEAAYMENFLANAMPYLKDTPEKIEIIDANDIIPNKKNFYGIRDVEKLAKSMAISGNVSPLEVVPQEDGKYRLLSGERRRAAVLLRKERGEIENTLVPCIVREKFVGNEDLTADQMEMISIIMANDYREKTPFEQLDEILQLEPIARSYWKKEQAEADGNMEAFRKFFAEKFLGMSSSSLQRILVYQKLVPEARDIFNQGKIKKTALSLIAAWPQEVQHQYFSDIYAGDRKGKIVDLRAFEAQNADKISKRRDAGTSLGDDSSSEDEVSEDISEAEVVTSASAKPDAPQSSSHTAWTAKPVLKDFPIEVNPNLSPEEAEKDGTNWVIEALNYMAKMAEEKSRAAEAEGQGKEAKVWNLRKAAVELVIERMR